MEFIVSRTSVYDDDDTPPCPEAVRKQNLWTVELSTLEDLAAFVGKYGPVVVEPYWENNALLHIDIYDDYRE